ncbi:hypothetical protein GGR54DRAFT_487027 [Hypoxylon sp. NC1633]|nr:hypothetical protein GGR54DRAFT_487027 [Hypoxylon sp. NC1633]
MNERHKSSYMCVRIILQCVSALVAGIARLIRSTIGQLFRNTWFVQIPFTLSIGISIARRCMTRHNSTFSIVATWLPSVFGPLRRAKVWASGSSGKQQSQFASGGVLYTVKMQNWLHSPINNDA